MYTTLRIDKVYRDRLKLSAAINKRTMEDELSHLITHYCKTLNHAGNTSGVKVVANG